MKFKDIKQMSKPELEAKLAELRMELLKNNAQVATGTTPKSPGLLNTTKKNIARILSVLQSEEPKT